MAMRRIAFAAALLAVLVVPSAARADNAANRMTMWTTCNDLVSMTDAQLDTWKSRGVGGLVCMSGWLPAMGGTANWTPLRNSNIGARAAARGIKIYLGAYLVNYWNTATPLAG